MVFKREVSIMADTLSLALLLSLNLTDERQEIQWKTQKNLQAVSKF